METNAHTPITNATRLTIKNEKGEPQEVVPALYAEQLELERNTSLAEVEALRHRLRGSLLLAWAIVKELSNHCKDPIHEEQIKELNLELEELENACNR